MISKIGFGLVLAALTLPQQHITFKPLYGSDTLGTSVATVWVPKTDLNIAEDSAIIATERSDGSVVIKGDPKEVIRGLVSDYAQSRIDDCRDTRRRDEAEYALVSAVSPSSSAARKEAQIVAQEKASGCSSAWRRVVLIDPKNE